MNTNKGKSTAGRIAVGAGLVAAGALGATALTGVALADDATAPGGAGTGECQEDGAGRGPGPNGGGLAGRMMHGEGTVRGPNGEFADVAVQFGTIDSVAGDSITVTSEDGVTKSYAIDAETRIMLDRQAVSATDLADGMQVRVLADADGDSATARVIGAHTEAFAQQWQERAEQREGRAGQPGERRGPWQDGTSDSGDA